MADLRGANAIVSFLRELRTVRRFRPGAIPRRVVEDILEVARWSGSAMNLQPWEFVMVWDRGTLEDLSRLEGYAGHLAGAAVGIVLGDGGGTNRAGDLRRGAREREDLARRSGARGRRSGARGGL